MIKTVPPKGVKGNILENNTAPNNDLDKVAAYRKGEVGSAFTTPDYSAHITNYKYNALNQLREQTTPDQGKTRFWYDEVGRLILSQNARQKDDGDVYSFTYYDPLDRIIEVGEVTAFEAYTDNENYEDFKIWLANTGNSFKDIVHTIYDVPYKEATMGAEFGKNAKGEDIGQRFLRNRVSAVIIVESMNEQDQNPENINAYDYNYATFYSYDIHGNVHKLVHHNPDLSFRNVAMTTVKMEYEYDLLSGNVNMLKYQEGKPDQFYHRYYYDADNRISLVESSRDGTIWEKESKNFYYAHGPLARKEIGQRQVQGLDYVYTINGWLKNINSGTLRENRDVGEDGSAYMHRNFAYDAFGLNLNYFEDDYEATDPRTSANDYLVDVGTLYDETNIELYNGNISQQLFAGRKENEDKLLIHANTYKYDQLNRIKSNNVYKSVSPTTDYVEVNNAYGTINTNTEDNDEYASAYAYDFNGNITSLTRNKDGATSAARIVDDLTYNYQSSVRGDGTGFNTQLP